MDVIIYHDPNPPREHMEVDARLVNLAARTGARGQQRLLSQPHCQPGGRACLNGNVLAGAMRPNFLPGEDLQVTVIKEGKEPGQGVGYLDDGTMVVIEKASHLIGQTLIVMVTSVLQTNAGKMLFAEVQGPVEEASEEG